jgi:ubiquitin C-terminal hydrolase
MSKSFVNPSRVQVSTCLPTDRRANLKLPNGDAVEDDATTMARQETFRINGAGNFHHFSSSSATRPNVFALSPALRQSIHKVQPAHPLVVVDSGDDKTITLDLTSFISPMLMSSTPTFASEPQSSQQPQSIQQSIPYYWRETAALACIDVLHTMIAKSVPQNLLRRQLRRRRRRIKRCAIQDEIDSTTSVTGERTKRHSKTARGIPNYGQTCFLNSILQSLAALEPFVLYLERLRNSSLGDNSSSSSFADVLTGLLQTINGQRNGRVDPRSLLRRIGEQHSQFRSTTREQQDAQELLQALMDMLIEESDVSTVSVGDSVLSLSSFLSQIDVDDGCNNEQQCRTRGDADAVKPESLSVHKAIIKDEDVTNGDGEEKKQDEMSVSHATDATEECRHVAATSSDVDELGCLIMDAEPGQSSEEQVRNSMFESISTISPSPLNGWIGSTLQCTQCHHVRPIQNSPFLDIGIVPTSVSKYINEGCYLNQPSKNSPASRYPSCRLSECLQNFIEVERVQGVECRQCTIKQQISIWDDEVCMLQGAINSLRARSKLEAGSAVQVECAAAEDHLRFLRTLNPDVVDQIPAGPALVDGLGQSTNVVLCRGDALKCLLLTRLPTIVCVHIQRRYYDPRLDRMAKTIQHVEFEEIMDFGKYSAYSGDDKGMIGKRDETSRKTSPVLYRLMSVVEHRGNAFGGHYVAYRRDVANCGMWVYVSDEVVKSIPWDEVKTRQAYMLFYEKM